MSGFFSRLLSHSAADAPAPAKQNAVHTAPLPAAPMSAFAASIPALPREPAASLAATLMRTASAATAAATSAAASTTSRPAYRLDKFHRCWSSIQSRVYDSGNASDASSATGDLPVSPRIHDEGLAHLEDAALAAQQVQIMIDILIEETQDSLKHQGRTPATSTIPSLGSHAGPCLEYLLDNAVLDRLVQLAAPDRPVGFRSAVLTALTSLLAHMDDRFLAQNAVHRATLALTRASMHAVAAAARDGLVHHDEMPLLQLIHAIAERIDRAPELLWIVFQDKRGWRRRRSSASSYHASAAAAAAAAASMLGTSPSSTTSTSKRRSGRPVSISGHKANAVAPMPPSAAETNKRNYRNSAMATTAPSPALSNATFPDSAVASEKPDHPDFDFPLFKFLLGYIHRDGAVGDIARAALLLLLEHATGPFREYLLTQSELVDKVSAALCALFADLYTTTAHPRSRASTPVGPTDERHNPRRDLFHKLVLFVQALVVRCPSTRLVLALLARIRHVFLQGLVAPLLVRPLDATQDLRAFHATVANLTTMLSLLTGGGSDVCGGPLARLVVEFLFSDADHPPLVETAAANNTDDVTPAELIEKVEGMLEDEALALDIDPAAHLAQSNLKRMISLASLTTLPNMAAPDPDPAPSPRAALLAEFRRVVRGEPAPRSRAPSPPPPSFDGPAHADPDLAPLAIVTLIDTVLTHHYVYALPLLAPALVAAAADQRAVPDLRTALSALDLHDPHAAVPPTMRAAAKPNTVSITDHTRRATAFVRAAEALVPPPARRESKMWSGSGVGLGDTMALYVRDAAAAVAACPDPDWVLWRQVTVPSRSASPARRRTSDEGTASPTKPHRPLSTSTLRALPTSRPSSWLLDDDDRPLMPPGYVPTDHADLAETVVGDLLHALHRFHSNTPVVNLLVTGALTALARVPVPYVAHRVQDLALEVVAYLKALEPTTPVVPPAAPAPVVSGGAGEAGGVVAAAARRLSRPLSMSLASLPSFSSILGGSGNSSTGGSTPPRRPISTVLEEDQVGLVGKRASSASSIATTTSSVGSHVGGGEAENRRILGEFVKELAATFLVQSYRNDVVLYV
ncbi:hypothetical protein GGF31_007360 [Allomyces arbusculus]|nr:hypothetical protein GGF31_007360 [Allomyces arbusculus]